MITKLVRDHCPAVTDGECEPAATESEYQMALLLKLHEEAQEIASDSTSPEEYADLLEVMLTLAEYNGVDGDEILEALVDKRMRRGGFEEGQIWTEGGRLEPPYPNIVVEVNFDTKIQVVSKVRELPSWLTCALKKSY